MLVAKASCGSEKHNHAAAFILNGSIITRTISSNVGLTHAEVSSISRLNKGRKGQEKV